MVILTQNKTHFAYRFHVVRKLLSEFAKQEVHRRRPKIDLRNLQLDRSVQDLEAKPSYQRVLYGPMRKTIQSERSIRTYFRTSQLERSERTYFRTSQSDRSIRTYVRTSQSDRSDGPTFRTNQSDRSDGPTFRAI